MTDSAPPAAPPGLRRPDDDPAYRVLREGDTPAFCILLADRSAVDFSYCDLGGVDLRTVEVGKILLRGARLKGADLRGLDLSQHDLHGVSINNARISGTLFPRDLSADELRLSLRDGTRLRHGKG
jgi:uncharacterized protein YjbI with pentapeptide repeats